LSPGGSVISSQSPDVPRDSRSDEDQLIEGRVVSRRQFLRMATAGLVAVGAGSGLAAILSGCTEEPPGTTIVSIPTTSTEATSTTTTVSAGPQVGRDINIGVVSPKTGSLALWAKAEAWWTERAAAVQGDGLICGDGMLHRLVFAISDSQSDTKRAGRVASELITDHKVDLVMASGHADLVNAVAEQAEALECPCIANLVRWQPFISRRGGVSARPFKWTYAHAIGLEDTVGNYLDMWQQVQTNRRVALLLPDDADGAELSDPSGLLLTSAKAAGLELHVGALYPVGTEDFTAHLREFKTNSTEICFGVLDPADFLTFWNQAIELEYRPRVLTIEKGIDFPQTLEALGKKASNPTFCSMWQPDWPYVDSVSGLSCQALADDYLDKTGEQWTVGVAQYAKFEWAVDVFKRVKEVDDKEDIIAMVGSSRLTTCLGPIDFTSPVNGRDFNLSRHPVENVYKAPLVGAQWTAGDKFSFEPRSVSHVNNYDLLINGRVLPMNYDS